MKALLVNYDYCTGCHSCEVACRNELGLGAGEYGIMVSEVGPIEYKDAEDNASRWDWLFMPTLMKACDLCASRVETGKLPSCVQHCQAWCLYYGEDTELVKKFDGKTRWSLLSR
jgi:Fe-S-cluster-containing dehydrogenase component